MSLFVFDTFSYSDEELVSLLYPKGGLDKRKIQELSQNIAKGVDRDPQNAIFEFKASRVQEFSPAKDGIVVKQDELTRGITGALEKLIPFMVRNETM